MSRKENGSGGMIIGIATVAAIFVILGLTIFAVLSLSTAAQEKELAERYAESVTRYWAADEKCTQTALEFRALWERGAASAELAQLAAEKGGELSLQGERVVIAYRQAINDYSHISARLSLGDTFEILEWKTVTEGAWQPDDTLNLWQGEP